MQRKESTIRQYERYHSQYNELTQHLSPDEIIDHLISQGKSPDLIRKILTALRYYGPESLHDSYTAAIATACKQINHVPFENKFNAIDWAEVLNGKINGVSMDISGSNLDGLIWHLFVLFPPRRNMDYSRMKYVLHECDATDEAYNYYVSETKVFIFQNYKTRRTFGIQRFVISDALANVIDRYIDANHIGDNSLLVRYSRKTSKLGYNDITFHNKVSTLFGTPPNGIRHAYISYLYKTPKNLLNISDISHKMAHRIETHLSYLDKKQFDNT
jgi:hypothetical protein